MSDDPASWGAQPVDDGPLAWGAKSAEPEKGASRGAMDKLTGATGERYQTWPERLVRHIGSSVMSGAALPGDVLQGKAQLPSSGAVPGSVPFGDPSSSGERVADLAGIATPISPALRAAVRPAPPQAAVPTREELSRVADEGYKEFRAVGAQYSPEITNALADVSTAAMNAKGRYRHLAEPVHQTVDLLRKEGETSLPELKSILEGLGGLRVDPDKKIRKAANIATAEIQKFLGRTEPEAAGALATADANFAAAARAKTLDEASEIAGLRAGRAGYGGNAVNSMRQVLSPIVEKAIKGNKQGYSPEEIAALQEIVTGSTATNTLRGIGQLSPSKGAIPTTLAIGSLGATGAVGAAANKLATILTSKQIDRLNELVRKRSPAYEAAVEKSTDKFLSSSDDFLTNPTQAGLLKTVVAARALSAGLTRDGIPIPSGELLRRLQGPTGAAAEDDQQQ